MARTGSEVEARAALTELIEEFPEEASKNGRLNQALYTVMDSMGKDDPQEGIALINQLTTEDAQKRAIASLVGGWAREDPAEAREWVDQLEPSPVRDAAAQRVTWGLIRDDPAAAFEVALTIQGEATRFQTLEYAFMELSKDDEEAARVALAAADVSDTERQKLLDRVE